MTLKDKYFPVLDHGFIALKDYMGSDVEIEQAARISYGAGTRKASDTRNLLRYMMRNRHTSPFEMAELKFHVRVPMDCWRQWIRHRTASINEYSTRYSKAINLCQETPPSRWRLQSQNNKQGSSGFLQETVDGVDMRGTGERLSKEEKWLHEDIWQVYNERLKAGVAREQARKDLPLSTYTEAFWKIDLHNLLHFLKLRCNSHAQFEIRQYANIIAGIVQELFPITFEAWKDYVFDSITLSVEEQQLFNWYIYHCIQHHKRPTNEEISKVAKSSLLMIDMSNREIDEFINKLDNFGLRTEFVLPSYKPYSYFQKETS